MKKEIIYQQDYWFVKKYDGRRKAFRGITRDDFKRACDKRIARERLHGYMQTIAETRLSHVRSDVKHFADIPYIYEGDGLDDFNRYQRPCSNGVGYVAICPGERGNNYYVDDPVTVRILTRKYNEWRANHAL